jgi:hypothetical protein
MSLQEYLRTSNKTQIVRGVEAPVQTPDRDADCAIVYRAGRDVRAAKVPSDTAVGVLPAII